MALLSQLQIGHINLDIHIKQKIRNFELDCLRQFVWTVQYLKRVYRKSCTIDLEGWWLVERAWMEFIKIKKVFWKTSKDVIPGLSWKINPFERLKAYNFMSSVRVKYYRIKNLLPIIQRLLQAERLTYFQTKYLPIISINSPILFCLKQILARSNVTQIHC